MKRLPLRLIDGSFVNKAHEQERRQNVMKSGQSPALRGEGGRPGSSGGEAGDTSKCAVYNVRQDSQGLAGGEGRRHSVCSVALSNLEHLDP